MSRPTPTRQSRQRKTPYERPSSPAPPRTPGGGLRTFISSLFWGRQRDGDESEDGDDHVSVAEEATRDDEEGSIAIEPPRDEATVPAIQAPPPSRARPAPSLLSTASTPNLSRFPGNYQSTLGARSPSMSVFSAAMPRQPLASTSQATQRGDRLMRDVADVSVPTAFTPHFSGVSTSTPTRTRPPRPLNNPFGMTASRTMPSLSTAAAPDSPAPPTSRKPQRRQLYLGPGYSAQSIARRKREQGQLTRSQSATAPLNSESIFKRRRMEEPMELPAVKAALASQPSFTFSFSAPLPPRAQLPTPMASTSTSTAGSPPAPPKPASPPKPQTRSAELIRNIFADDKAEQESKLSSLDVANPYERLDSPIVRAANPRPPRRSLRVPREQVKKPPQPAMTSLQKMEATMPAEYRKSLGKRVRKEDDADASDARQPVASTSAPAKAKSPPPRVRSPPARVASPPPRVKSPPPPRVKSPPPAKAQPKAPAAKKVPTKSVPETISLDDSDEDDVPVPPPAKSKSMSKTSSKDEPASKPAFSFSAAPAPPPATIVPPFLPKVDAAPPPKPFAGFSFAASTPVVVEKRDETPKGRAKEAQLTLPTLLMMPSVNGVVKRSAEAEEKRAKALQAVLPNYELLA